MKKIFFLLLLNSVFTFSQNKNNIQADKLTQNSNFKLDFMSVNMPDNEDNLGLAGIHYNLLLNNWAYAGVGFYGAVTGIRGGFFTLGVNAGIKKQLYKNLYFDTGFQFGGGGGSGAPDGGGAYILPHLNLGYAFKYFSLETGYSYLNFFDNGNINSSQLNFAIQIPIPFNYTTFDKAEKSIASNQINDNLTWNNKSKKISTLIHFNNLDLIGTTKNNDGELITDKTIQTVGIELNTYFQKNAFFFLKADGAYHGIPSGYMDIILGMGYQFSFNKDRTKLLGKMGVGAAGGGSVDIQGGFIIYPDLSLEQKLFNNIYLSINKGFLLNPNAHFSSSTYGIGLKYYVNQNGLISKEGKTYTSAKFKGKEIMVGQELYLNAARDYGGTKNMQQIYLHVNLYLNKYFYLSGQASFANFGGAGAYAEGLAGIGLGTPQQFSDNFKLFVQFLTGAAGGGHVETGEGLIIKPSIGASFYFDDKLGLTTSIGQSKAINGNLNSTFINAGLSFRFATLKAK